MPLTMRIDIQSHLPDVLEDVERAKRAGLIACGFTAESHAKEYETAVDTGRLRNSITHAEDDTRMVVGTNVEYAPYIEFGCPTHVPLHYLRQSITNHLDQYKSLLEAALSSK